MGYYFEYDRLIDSKDICNYNEEKKIISDHVNAGDCLKIYGLRNFGKTSLIKNVIAEDWEAENPKKRIIIYADLYSVETNEDISFEITKAFNISISKKLTLLDKSLDWLKSLKNIRPVWRLPVDSNDMGEFSIHTEKNEAVVDFEIVFDNINNLYNKFEFLIVLDEFQEISKIKGAEAKLRNSLQKLNNKVPVIVLGSKYHLLKKIFNRPKAPFHQWGMTLELSEIKYDEYFEYMKARFAKAGKTISPDVSKYIQDKMNRIPEAINRLCDFIARDESIKEVTTGIIDRKINSFLELSASNYSGIYSALNQKERTVLKALACADKVKSVMGKDFLKNIPGISKSGVNEIVNRFLDNSLIYKIERASTESFYTIADPFLKYYVAEFKTI
jgi:AAA+ ATPase superfamily predicted ATPase